MSKVNLILDWQIHLILQQTVIQSVSPDEELHITETMHTDARESAKQQLLAEVLDIVGDGVPMFFGSEYPVFKNLAEYTAHVAKIRQIQRDEIIKAAKERFK